MATKFGLGKGLGALIPETVGRSPVGAAGMPGRDQTDGSQRDMHSASGFSSENLQGRSSDASFARNELSGEGTSRSGEDSPEVNASPFLISSQSSRVALLPGGEEVAIIPLSAIRPDPGQPRRDIPEASIEELASSIARHGLIQPIIVERISGEAGTEGREEGRPETDGSVDSSAGEVSAGTPGPGSESQVIYRIVAGERRYRASIRAGLTEIPAIVRQLNRERRLEISLIENIQREDLNPVDEAEAYRRLMELTGATQDQVAEAVGKSRPAIANALRLLRLQPVMLDALRSGSISSGHARALLAIPEGRTRETVFQRIMDEGISVRQAEEAASGTSRTKKGSAKSRSMQQESGDSTGGNGASGSRREGRGRQLDPDLADYEQRLIHRLGTKVNFKGDAQKGIIEVEYYSLDDLERILGTIGG